MEPRDLLGAGPSGYIAARDAEVARRRAAGDREGAAAIRALAKPALSLWAVLVASDDEGLAARAVDATDELLDAQRRAVEQGARGTIGPADAARRRAIDAVVDAAVAALDRADRPPSPERREEIRDIVDRLTRRRDLLAQWLDGTLRDIPDDTGFSAFEGLAVPARPARRAQRPHAPAPPAAPAAATAAVDLRALRAARKEVERQAALVAQAERRVEEARRRAAEAARVFEEDERALEAARAAHDAALRRCARLQP